MRICSWNVNGLRAVAKRGFRQWLEDCGADIVAVQESRAHPEQLPDELREPKGWHIHVHPAARKGYSGVALFSRRAPDTLETSLGEARYDDEGRVQIARFGRLVIANVYFPNGSGRNRDHSRVPYKLDFTRRIEEVAAMHRKKGRRVLVMGDFNTAHHPIDLARPKTNLKTSGFLIEERAELDRWVNAGWIDTFRSRQPDPGHYTWWSQRFGVRERNIGWRIDYVFASRAANRFVTRAFIKPQVMGSDHCPIGVDLDPAIVA